MNYRKLFFVAVAIDVLLAAGLYWVGKGSRPAPAPIPVEHPPMQGFSANPAETPTSPLTPLELTPERMQSIGVRIGKVEYKTISSEIRATGAVEVDERRLGYVQTRYPGWIRHVWVSATYQFVRKGEPLFTIYSPDLVAGEQEYMLAKANAQKLQNSSIAGVSSGSDVLLRSARERLLQWNLAESDIARLDAGNQPLSEFTFPSPLSGYVIERMALPNAYVQPEMRLYTIADLSSVWVNAKIFQEDVGKVKPGDHAEVTVDAYPEQSFRARVDQILPEVDSDTRTVRVRLSIPNPKLLLKPGMFVNVALRAALGRQLVVPASAVLQSGTRKIAFLSRSPGVFEPREVQLGVRTDDGFVVTKGLVAGDEVITSANFLIDSESQLQTAAGSYAPPSPSEVAKVNAAEARTSAEFTTDPSPPRKGSNLLQVRLAQDKKPLSGADVTVQLYMPGMPEMGMPAMNASAHLRDQGDGSYTGQLQLDSGGTWQVTITADQGGKRLLTKRTSLNATGGMGS